MFEEFYERMANPQQKRLMKTEAGSEQDKKLSDQMLKNRTILLSSDVTPATAKRILEQLLVLESMDREKPITMIINSPGGDVSSGLAIYDQIRFIEPRVRIICTGLTASIATIILSAVDKKDRLTTPMSRFLLHQPLIPMDVYGPASELEITANEILKTKESLNGILARATGKPIDVINEDTKRDFWLSAQEALDYGLVGRIIEHRSDLND